jgi:hypothetical protein
MIATVLGTAGFIAGAAALVLALIVMRQSAEVVDDLRAHRRAHARATGTADPERRRRQDGPPPGQPERRSPVGTHRATEPVPTGELEAPDLPTTQLPAQPRPVPRRSDLA